MKIDSPFSIDKISTASAQTLLKPEPNNGNQAFVNDCVFNDVKEREKCNDYEESNINNLFNWNSDGLKGEESYQEENNWNSNDFFLYN